MDSQLARIFDSQYQSTKNKVKNNLDLIERHNAYVMYVATVCLFFTNGRPVKDFMCFLSREEAELGMFYFEDKYRRPRLALRIVGVPPVISELIENYRHHLLGLACALKRNHPKQIDLISVVYKLHQGSLITGTPLFFLIDENFRTCSIEHKHIKQWLDPNQAIQPNIGRHHFAAGALMAGFDPQLSSLRLGHHVLNDHLLGKNSTLVLNSVMSQQAMFVQQQMGDLEVKVLKGIGVYDQNLFGTLSSSNDDTINIHTSKLGPHSRLEKRKAQKQEERTFVAKLIVYVRQLFKVPELIDADYQYEVKANLIRYGYPNSESWKSFHKLLKNTPFNLPNFLLDFPSVGSYGERNPFTKNMIKRYAELESYRTQWITYLESRQDLDLIERISSIIITAALFGGLFDRRLLALLPSSLMTTCYQTSSVLHVELYQPIEEKLEWVTRWEPDLLSSALIAGLARCLKKSKQRNPKNLDAQVVDSISKIISQIGLENSEDVFYVLEKISKVQQKFEQPGFIAARGPEARFTNVLSEQAYVRLLTDKIPTLDDDHSSPDRPRAERISMKAIKSPSAKVSEAYSRNLSHFFSNAEDQKRKRKTDGSKKALLKKTAVKVQSLQEKSPNAAQIWHIISGWIIFLCHNGTLHKAVPAFSTLQKYIPIITKSVPQFIGDRDITNIAIEELDKFYAEQLSVNSSDSETRRMIFTHFHNFLIDSLRIRESEILDNYKGSKFSHSFGIGNMVTDADYQSALTIVRADQRLSDREALHYQAMLILMNRFGLRIGEAFETQVRDIVFDQNESLEMVIIRRRKGRILKSISAARRIPTLKTLPDCEKDVLWKLCDGVTLNRQNQSCALFSVKQGESSLISESETTRYLGQLLKDVTGDSSVVLHTLRHSFITRTVAELFTKIYELEDSYWLSGNNLSVEQLSHKNHITRALSAVSEIVGHENLSTTLEHYIRCTQLLPTKGDDSVVLKLFKKKTLALILNESVPNFRRRGSDIPSAVKQSIINTKFAALDDQGYKKFDAVAYIKNKDAAPDEKLKAKTIESIFYDIAINIESISVEAHHYDASEEKIKRLIDESQKIEHASKFDVYQLYKQANDARDIIQKKPAAVFRSEHSILNQALEIFETEVEPQWSDQERRTFVEGIDSWRDLIDSKNMDLVGDRKYMLTPLFNLADLLGFKFELTNKQRESARSKIRRSSFIYNFTNLKNHSIGVLIDQERTFHKLIFILTCWFNANELAWRKL